HATRTAYHATVKAVKTTGKFIKNHAAAITSIVVSTAVFAGCEAATWGVGTIGCAALAGAAGSLVEQGFKCAQNGGGDCSAGAFAGSAVEGAVTGALGGALGSLGGKLLAKAAPKAMEVVGGLFGKGATEAGEAGAADATDEAASAAESEGAGTRSQSQSGSCPVPTHSFIGSTRVLMADGATKAIDQVKVGDTIANSVPGVTGTEAHKVTAVIVTHTDHDFVDLTIKATAESAAKQGMKDGAKSLAKKVARKAAFGLAASAAVLGALAASHGHGTAQEPATKTVAAVSSATPGQNTKPAEATSDAQGAHLTTTFHHPLYDETQSAFVEGKDLKAGDVLQTPTGTAEVTRVRLYHANTTTYDLTIGTLHTYYVEAGTTPVLVHNCQINPGDNELSQRVMQERLRINKRTGNGAAALIRSADGQSSRISVAFASKGLGNHAEAKLVNQFALEEGESIAEVYSEREPCTGSNDCRGLLNDLGIKYTYSFPWTTSAEGAASTKGLGVYWKQLFGDAKSGDWTNPWKGF
ncbi:nucleic acid/nucleotide deaminase domain-containing protein, partial [Streptomyces hokutonensis]|uniref:nucleic acid/nucleotide deaminase domain-containing protein n=1 Tax=Streptomyces hokutonensis TaxID=1306990 RepID=UPI0033E0E2D8